MPAWVAIGWVGRAHGVEGAFVVEEGSEEGARYAPGSRVYAGREPVEVVESKRSGGRVVVRLERSFPRGTILELPAAELPETEEGSYYVFQLVGLVVEEEGGRPLGRVREVVPGIANDVLELEGGILLPMVEECVLRVDLEEGRIVVAPGFAAES